MCAEVRPPASETEATKAGWFCLICSFSAFNFWRSRLSLSCSAWCKRAIFCRYSLVCASWFGPVSSSIIVSHGVETGAVARSEAKRLGWNGIVF